MKLGSLAPRSTSQPGAHAREEKTKTADFDAE
jgi:hypothetical protein